MESVMGIFMDMLSAYGRQRWWPVSGRLVPDEWEVCAGAILVQNTGWGNVEKSLEGLANNGLIRPRDIIRVEKDIRLESIIRPSGLHLQKLMALKSLAAEIERKGGFRQFIEDATREGLLSIKGIGPETADSILLYALGRPSFIADKYTRRVLSRIGVIGNGCGYSTTKGFLEEELPMDPELYNEFHALIVEHAKRHCRKTPLCVHCPLKKKCSFNIRKNKNIP